MNQGFDILARSYSGGLEDPAKKALTGSYLALVDMKLRILKEIKKKCFGFRKIRILDFGCGTGEIAVGLARFPGIKQVDGADASAGMIREARSRQAGSAKKNIRWIWLGKKGLPSKTYDWILAINTFHHLPPCRRISTAKKLIRNLAPGGVFTILEHSSLNPLTRWIVSRCPFDRGVKLLSPREGRKLVSMAGSPPQTRYLGFFPPSAPGTYILEKLFRNMPFGVQFLVWAKKPKN